MKDNESPEVDGMQIAFEQLLERLREAVAFRRAWITGPVSWLSAEDNQWLSTATEGRPACQIEDAATAIIVLSTAAKKAAQFDVAGRLREENGSWARYLEEGKRQG